MAKFEGLTDAQIAEILCLYEKTHNQRQVAEITNHSTGTISKYIRAHGKGPGRGHNQKKKITDEQILQGIAEGLTRGEIADKYNVHVENLARRMRKLGVHAVHAIPEQCKHRTMGKWHYVSSADERVKKDHPDFDYIESRRKSKNSGNEYKVKCKRCGQVSIKHSLTRNFFCAYCREEKKKLKKDAYAKQLAMEAEKPKACKECGGVFYSQYAGSLYCSSYCKGKAKRERQKERDPEGYKQKHRTCNSRKYIERARKYGCAYEYGVTRKKVIERDGRKCMICGKTCDERDKSWGSFGPDYPTLDHIVPLSKGGAHSWDNVQCACGECNVKKGAEQITV